MGGARSKIDIQQVQFEQHNQNEIDLFIKQFEDQLQLNSEKKKKDIEEKKAKGEPYPCSSDEEDLEKEDDETEEKFIERKKQWKEDYILQKAKDEEERKVKFKEAAKKRFTYKQLIKGLKEKKFKKIVVLTGAGISVSAGIPDFRSPKTGLYANLEKYELPNPQAIFDIEFFQEKPQAFYQLAKEFLDLQKFNPTPTHYFIRLLHDMGLLQICMTQNIDNLESKIGIDMDRYVVQAHGANMGATCSKCKAPQDRAELDKAIQAGNVMYCKLQVPEKVDTGEKTLHGEPKFIDGKPVDCKGPVKPNITFFGEALPKKFSEGQHRIQNAAKENEVEGKDLEPEYEDGGCDLMIVIGTGLAVYPFAGTVDFVQKDCPQVLINLENTDYSGFDFDNSYTHPKRLFLKGKCDDVVRKIVTEVGWAKDFDALLGKKAPAAGKEEKKPMVKQPMQKGVKNVKKMSGKK